MEYQSLVMVGKDWKAIPKKNMDVFLLWSSPHSHFWKGTRNEVCNIDP